LPNSLHASPLQGEVGLRDEDAPVEGKVAVPPQRIVRVEQGPGEFRPLIEIKDEYVREKVIQK
jgi:hypothetical protein